MSMVSIIFFVVRLSVNDCNNTITHGGWFVCCSVDSCMYTIRYSCFVSSFLLLVYCSLFVVCEQNVVLYWGEENNWTQYLSVISYQSIVWISIQFQKGKYSRLGQPCC